MNWTVFEFNKMRFDWIMITRNLTLIGLNWTVLLKCLEKTFVVIWHYINEIELN